MVIPDRSSVTVDSADDSSFSNNKDNDDRLHRTPSVCQSKKSHSAEFQI